MSWYGDVLNSYDEAVPKDEGLVRAKLDGGEREAVDIVGTLDARVLRRFRRSFFFCMCTQLRSPFLKPEPPRGLGDPIRVRAPHRGKVVELVVLHGGLQRGEVVEKVGGHAREDFEGRTALLTLTQLI